MRAVQLDQGLVDIRDAMFGKYGTIAWSYANLADGMMRTGNPELAVAVWQGAVRKVPGDVALWTGFGTALAEHDGNQISPAAQLAFDRALALSPSHPGPPFFYGLALVRAGRFAEAKPWWEKAVALTPETATYRRELMMRLIALEMFLAEAARREQRADEAPKR
jgi:cytochrome c-type biogenesis protein CcmH/NrfG